MGVDMHCIRRVDDTEKKSHPKRRLAFVKAEENLPSSVSARSEPHAMAPFHNSLPFASDYGFLDSVSKRARPPQTSG